MILTERPREFDDRLFSLLFGASEFANMNVDKRYPRRMSQGTYGRGLDLGVSGPRSYILVNSGSPSELASVTLILMP